MDKEQFQQWAIAVVMQVEAGKEESEAFAKMVEQVDKGAAAMLRKLNKQAEELSTYLQKTLDKGEG